MLSRPSEKRVAARALPAAKACVPRGNRMQSRPGSMLSRLACRFQAVPVFHVVLNDRHGFALSLVPRHDRRREVHGRAGVAFPNVRPIQQHPLPSIGLPRRSHSAHWCPLSHIPMAQPSPSSPRSNEKSTSRSRESHGNPEADPHRVKCNASSDLGLVPAWGLPILNWKKQHEGE